MINAAADFATAVILGVWSTVEDAVEVSICCSPLSVMATMFNTFEVTVSSDHEADLECM